MAIVAEKSTIALQEFDWDFAESQFSEVQDPVFRPEDEIYGRSLGTIRRLGAFMINKSGSEIINSPEAAQAKAEFYTSVEEGFGTDMELGGGLEVRDFDRRPVISGRVMAKDNKTAVSSMTEAGLKCAIETTEKDWRFRPQLTRSKWDHQNALLVDKMARGEMSYNTRIVISPFPEEAAVQSGDEYWRNIGYVPHLRRGFVQLYHATESGLVTGSLSFDGSNKQQLRKIFNQLGVEIPQDEITDNWLKYAITCTVSEDEAKVLATEIANTATGPAYEAAKGHAKIGQREFTNTVDVTKQHKPIMERVFNESYVHICESLARGHQTREARKLISQLAEKAHHFNGRFASALYKMRAHGEQFTDDDSIVLHELLVYSTIEIMRALHLQKTKSDSSTTHNNYYAHPPLSYLQTVNPSLFQNILGGFGAEGARSNRTYSACGLSISLGGVSSEGSPQSTFGGVDRNEEGSRKKLMSCPFCKAKVFDDPCATVLSCWDCRARVVNGRVVSKGDGGSQARAAKQKAEEEQRQSGHQKSQEAAIAKRVGGVVPETDGAAVEAKENIRSAQLVAQVALRAVSV